MEKKLEIKLKDFTPVCGFFRFENRYDAYTDEIGFLNRTKLDSAKFGMMFCYHYTLALVAGSVIGTSIGVGLKYLLK